MVCDVETLEESNPLADRILESVEYLPLFFDVGAKLCPKDAFILTDIKFQATDILTTDTPTNAVERTCLHILGNTPLKFLSDMFVEGDEENFWIDVLHLCHAHRLAEYVASCDGLADLRKMLESFNDCRCLAAARDCFDYCILLPLEIDCVTSRSKRCIHVDLFNVTWFAGYESKDRLLILTETRHDSSPYDCAILGSSSLQARPEI